MGVSTIAVAGKQVILVDCSNLSEAEKIIDILKKGSALVATKPGKSVNIITDVTNLHFNSSVAAAFKEYAASNTRFVKESVIVGMSGLHTIVFSAIKALTRREFHLSSTMEDAKTYLASA